MVSLYRKYYTLFIKNKKTLDMPNFREYKCLSGKWTKPKCDRPNHGSCRNKKKIFTCTKSIIVPLDGYSYRKDEIARTYKVT